MIYFEPVTLLTSHNVEQPKVPESTPELQNMIAAAKHNLSDSESRELEELLTEYGDVFAMDRDDYGRTDRVHHSINTGGTQPIRQPPRSLTLANRRMCARC
jgi:hypothetical protein